MLSARKFGHVDAKVQYVLRCENMKWSDGADGLAGQGVSPRSVTS